jgi:NTP pyrophosphatase (non-canonical NTP hydrolase)
VEALADVVPFLGLAGETGELLNEYKKYVRDGSAHVRFRDRLREELGDLLWYLADAASRFDLRLSEVAETNLAKVRDRWGDRGSDEQLMLYGNARVFDEGGDRHEKRGRVGGENRRGKQVHPLALDWMPMRIGPIRRDATSGQLSANKASAP